MIKKIKGCLQPYNTKISHVTSCRPISCSESKYQLIRTPTCTLYI